MARARLDTGPLPAGAVASVIEYRVDTKPPGEWHRLGQSGEPVSVWTVRGEAPVRFRARFVAKGGQPMSPWKESGQWDPKEPIGDRTDPADLTWPAPQAVPDGAAIEVTFDVPERENPAEYQFEVRTGDATGAAIDAWQVGIFDATETALVHIVPDAGSQEIHVRPIRIEDNRLGAFTTTTVSVPAPPFPHTEDHTNGFAAGTLVAPDSMTPTPFEISGGDLRHAAIYAGDVDSYAGDSATYAGDAGLYWSPAVYITADFTLDAPEDVMFQVWPDLTSTTRPTLYAGDATWPARGPRYQENGTATDPRTFDNGLQNGADQTPLVLESKVATTATLPASFTYPDDYATIVPGKVYPNVAAYKVAFLSTTYVDKRITIDNLIVRRWRYCRSRPWHSHGRGWELLGETVATSSVSSLTVSSLPSDGFDELLIEIDWKNVDTTGTGLLLRFNGDSGANYYDTAARTSCILPASIAQNERQFTKVRVRAETGEIRGVWSESAAWIASAATTDPVSATYHWTNTSSEITSVSVTAASAASAIGSGDYIRVFGWRRNKAAT